jgi:uncharacterized protein YjiS (DUF1127 family)
MILARSRTMIASPRLVSPTFTRSASAARQPARGLLATLERWAERHRQRRALLELSNSMLKDIGLSYADAWQEGRKPFWRA